MKQNIVDIVIVAFGADHRRSGYAIRVLSMIKILCDIGYKVGVLRLVPAFHKAESWSNDLLLAGASKIAEILVPPTAKYNILRQISTPYCKAIIMFIKKYWKPLAIQAEGHHAGYYVLAIRKSEIPVIVDIHGAVPEEAIYNKNKNSEINYKSIGWINKIEQKILNSGAKIFVVSEEMKEHLNKKWNKINTNNFFIIPIALDKSFNYNYSKIEQKKHLGLRNKTIFVYSGSAQDYQCIANIGKWFKAISELVSGVHLLILTPEIEKIKRELNYDLKYMSENVSFFSCEKSQIPSLLACGDYAFSLRDDSIINKVSCPTKIAEYLSQGLFLICTKFSGHAPKLIEKFNCGIVIPLNIEKSELNRIVSHIENRRVIDKIDNSEILSEYMHNSIQAKIESIYRSIC